MLLILLPRTFNLSSWTDVSMYILPKKSNFWIGFQDRIHCRGSNNINKHAHEHESQIHANETKKTNSELVNRFFDIPQEAFSEAEEQIANWNCFMAKWQELCESKQINAVMPEFTDFVPAFYTHNFNLRLREYGLDGLFRAIDKIWASPFFKSRTLGLKTFLSEKTIPTLESGGYDWNPDEPNEKPKPNKPKTYERDDEIRRQNELEYERLRAAGKVVFQDDSGSPTGNRLP